MSSYAYRYEKITAADVPMTDLQQELIEIAARGETAECYRITVYPPGSDNPAPEAAFAVRAVESERTGIAWGADASWDDALESIEQDIEAWLDGSY